MTVKRQIPTDEWEKLLKAPILAGMVMITADLNIPGLLDEGKALIDSINNVNVPDPAYDIISDLSADLQLLPSDVYKIPSQVDAAHPDKQNRMMLEKLEHVGVILDTRLTLAESEGFKQWLLSIARSVSKASRESVHFGGGGEAMSEKEDQSLEKISNALNSPGND